MNETTEIPAGMVEVTKDEFFRLLYADPRDIMPTTEHPTQTFWRLNRYPQSPACGWSSRGWKNDGPSERWAWRK